MVFQLLVFTWKKGGIGLVYQYFWVSFFQKFSPKVDTLGNVVTVSALTDKTALWVYFDPLEVMTAVKMQV